MKNDSFDIIVKMNNELKRPEIVRVAKDDLTSIGLGKYVNDYIEYNGQPFSGFLVEEYYENGNIHLEKEYHKGEQLGWEMEYYSSGKIAYEALMYGATTILFNEYDEAGLKVEGGIVATKELYNECLRAMGIEEIQEND